MSQREYVRDLTIMVAATLLVLAVLALAGPIAALIVGALMIPGTAIGMLAAAIVAGLDELAEADAREQEADARAQLRVVRTVEAQVIQFPQRRRGDAA